MGCIIFVSKDYLPDVHISSGGGTYATEVLHDSQSALDDEACRVADEKY